MIGVFRGRLAVQHGHAHPGDQRSGGGNVAFELVLQRAGGRAAAGGAGGGDEGDVLALGAGDLAAAGRGSQVRILQHHQQRVAGQTGRGIVADLAAVDGDRLAVGERRRGVGGDGTSVGASAGTATSVGASAPGRSGGASGAASIGAGWSRGASPVAPRSPPASVRASRRSRALQRPVVDRAGARSQRHRQHQRHPAPAAPPARAHSRHASCTRAPPDSR